MEKNKKLIIVGDSAFAEVAYEYFTFDSQYEVVAFCVEKAFITKETLFDLPIVPFEDMLSQFPTSDYEVFVATVYTKLNRLRARLCRMVKEKGYQLASYISSKAFVWRNCQIGEHCFIFENNVVQPFVTLGDNVILWSGNHIGHHSTIDDNCFISSHVVVSGFVTIGKNCFVGVNATFANNLTVGDDCFVAANGLVVKSIDANHIVKGKEAKEGAKRLFGVRDEDVVCPG